MPKILSSTKKSTKACTAARGILSFFAASSTDILLLFFTSSNRSSATVLSMLSSSGGICLNLALGIKTLVIAFKWQLSIWNFTGVINNQQVLTASVDVMLYLTTCPASSLKYINSFQSPVML